MGVVERLDELARRLQQMVDPYGEWFWREQAEAMREGVRRMEREGIPITTRRRENR